jgi:hypothetical protein
VIEEPNKASEQGLANGLQSKHWLLGFVFLLVIFTAAAQPISDPDFWWHLRTGQYIVETRSIPRTDIFSNLTAGTEWVAHEWASEVFMYYVFRALGYAGLIVVFSILITAAFLLVYLQCRKRHSHPYIAGIVLLLGAGATLPTWGVRPQMFSLFFASVFISLLYDYYNNRNTRGVWWLLPLIVLWANIHAGFAAGLALMILTIAGLAFDAFLLRSQSPADIWRRVRPLSLLFILCLAAILLNPRGLRLYSYPFETLNSRAMMQYIEEWKSPDFHNPLFQALALLMFATLAALALSHKRVRPGELLMLIVTGWATLRSARNVGFFALVATPLLAEHSWIWLSSQEWPKRFGAPAKLQRVGKSPLESVLNSFLLVLALGVVAFGVFRAVAKQPEVEAQQFPKGAVDFIRTQRPPEPIYNEYVWGGYLIWELYPDYRVYIDGRADVYGDSMVKEFLDIHDGHKAWRQLLDNRGIQTVLIKSDIALATLLIEDNKWQKVFEDKQAVIFVRR